MNITNNETRDINLGLESPKVDSKKVSSLVYCKDCKFLRVVKTQVGNQGVCIAIAKSEDYWYAKRKRYPLLPSIQNGSNHCTFFKKKPWWQFWRKKLGRIK